MESERRGEPFGWVHLASMGIGVLQILAPLLMTKAHGGAAPPQAFWNDLAVGVLLILVAAVGSQTQSAAPNWTEAGIGAWLMAAPILLWYGGSNLGWSDMLLGLVLAFCGSYAAVAKTWGAGGRVRGM